MPYKIFGKIAFWQHIKSTSINWWFHSIDLPSSALHTSNTSSSSNKSITITKKTKPNAHVPCSRPQHPHHLSRFWQEHIGWKMCRYTSPNYMGAKWKTGFGHILSVFSTDGLSTALISSFFVTQDTSICWNRDLLYFVVVFQPFFCFGTGLSISVRTVYLRLFFVMLCILM